MGSRACGSRPVGLLITALGAGGVCPDTVEDSCRHTGVGPLDGTMQETQKRSHSPNPEAALRALLGVELQAPAGTPAHIALHVMREVLLRPGMIIAAPAKANHSGSSSDTKSADFPSDDQLGAFTLIGPPFGVRQLD
jgi:hypothetical protein